MAYRWTIDDVNSLTGRVRMREVPPARAKQKKPAKYRNVKATDATGNVHDSGKEYRNWCDLQLREKAGEISNLRRHVRFDFCHNGVFIGFYTADATYEENGRLVVEDTKSEATRKIRDYPLRRNLMKACHNIEIKEV